ncbi:MAG: DUF4333 domain-containing protein [Actinobacteria bacterium]|nr:DUF4333 domain-containing protein [Actinomycetota bacterium]
MTTPRTLALALPAGALLALAGCGSIDATKTENAVKQEIARSIGAKLRSVECPEDIPLERGRNFVCTAIGADGTRAPVPVTQTDDAGNVEFEAQLVKPRVVETGLVGFAQRAAKAGGGGGEARAAARCPELRPVKRGDVILCSLTFHDGSTVVGTATQTDDQGKVKFDLRRR